MSCSPPFATPSAAHPRNIFSAQLFAYGQCNIAEPCTPISNRSTSCTGLYTPSCPQTNLILSALLAHSLQYTALQTILTEFMLRLLNRLHYGPHYQFATCAQLNLERLTLATHQTIAAHVGSSLPRDRVLTCFRKTALEHYSQSFAKQTRTGN